MRFAFGLSVAITLITSILFAETKTSAAPAAGKKIYVANCATCHGPDGKGSSMGRTVGVKDLHSTEVMKMSNAQMEHVIANGKGNMPPWKAQLSQGQIAEVAAFVRSLQKTSK
jgi:cytochrome c6